jgi:trigger factor
MAENETAGGAVAEQQQDEQDFTYAVTVEDAGPGTKKVSVEIPQERIATKLAEQFKGLRKQATIPGFRPGHAPQKLVEKMFANDVRDQVRGDLIRESYEQALEKNSLQVLGEPEFDNAEEIKLPDDGPLTYSFSVEVQPEFTLPDLANLKVKKPGSTSRTKTSSRR